MKANIQAGHLPEQERDRAHLDALSAECYASADYAEGRLAFAEKRRPQFTGR